MTQSENERCFEFSWTIEHFALCRHKANEFLESPVIEVQNLECTRWYLKLYPKGLQDHENIMCFLNRTDVGLPEIKIKYSISIEGSDCESVQSFKRKAISDRSVKVDRERFLRSVDINPEKDILMVRCRLLRCYDEVPNRQTVLDRELVPYPVNCSAYTLVPIERRKRVWTIKKFSRLPSQHEVSIPIVSSSPLAPKLWVTLSWSDESPKEGSVLKMEVREMPELAGKTFQLGCRIQLVDGKKKHHKMAQGWYLFTTTQRGYFLWIKTYSDSVWNFPLSIDRGTLFQKRDNYLQDDALVLDCDFILSYEAELSYVKNSSYVRPEPEPEPQPDPETEIIPNRSWQDILLREFGDQPNIFKFFWFLFLFLVFISHAFKENNPPL